LKGKKRILVTSALPYANGPIHLGHLAGAYLPADIFVRYHRLKGNDVVYICGSDEHGVPIMLRARTENKSPQEVVDYYHAKNEASFKSFGINFNYYGRTSAKIHHETSQDFFRKLAQKNVFVLKKDKQLYDSKANMFLADRFVRGTCPNCGYEDAYGDQCEDCGISLNPTDLNNPRSAVTNSKPELRESTHWYLPLAKFQKDLENWIATHSEWKSNVLGQVNSWFEGGLKDRAVTRDLSWGVPVPDDIAQEAQMNVQGKVLYVWFDAPIGYISATKEWAIKQKNKNLWKQYWQDKDTRLIHFIGKDNIVFHCLIFPAMLMAHGEFILPENVPANEFLTIEGNKLSTSRNYAVWLDDYLEKFEPDSLRYCLANILPETRDTDFSWKGFQSRHNNELADILGNLVNRTLTFNERYFNGKVPQKGEYNTLDKMLIDIISKTPNKVGIYIDTFQIRLAIKEIMDMARFANKYFNDKTPWKTIKNDIENCATTINLCLETIRSLAILLEPIIPFTSAKIKSLLNISNLANEDGWESAAELSLHAGHKINKPKILFAKLDDSQIDTEISKLKLVGISEKSEDISIDYFKKVDLRVAKVVDAKQVKNTKKLMNLTVLIGKEERQIIAGIAERVDPEYLVGKNIIVVVNLKPAKICGQISRGMLLAAGDGDKLSLLTTLEEMPPGTKIK
jgi:methionyl-tRNA synthetase